MPRKLVDLSTEELVSLYEIFLGKDSTSVQSSISSDVGNKMMKNLNREGSRKEIVDRYGFDVKFAAHAVRLALEVEQILAEGDLDLRRHSAQLRAIRNGEWPLEQIEHFLSEKEAALEKVYHESTVLPYGPREDEIKQLLMDCLEHHYGSLSACIVTEDRAVAALRKIAEIAQEGLS